MSAPDSRALYEIQAALTTLGIPFCVVGSHASSARGEPRATMDVDLLARIANHQADRPWRRSWGQAGRSMWKPCARRFAGAGLSTSSIFRRASNSICSPPSTSSMRPSWNVLLADGIVKVPVATGEDVILAKLQWYRAGGEVSENQWRDIVGLLSAGPRDSQYLRAWAARLNVNDLLSKALAEVSGDQAL